MKHGWFSLQAARQLLSPIQPILGTIRANGTIDYKRREPRAGSVWCTPEGEEVLVVVVTNDDKHHGTNWPDMTYVGPVTKYVRDGVEIDLMGPLRRQ